MQKKKNDTKFEYFSIYARVVKVNKHVKFPSLSFRRKGKGQQAVIIIPTSKQPYKTPLKYMLSNESRKDEYNPQEFTSLEYK